MQENICEWCNKPAQEDYELCKECEEQRIALREAREYYFHS